ncbi:MAG: hypothetical protein C0404_10470 [Verrucomicrobia bacterium]|nr:hypothetical protein [Verrucomicrobiota bacterium]
MSFKLGVMMGALCVACMAGAKDGEPAAAAPVRSFTNLVAFGDSITKGYAVKPGEGWVELLKDLIRKEFTNKTVAVFNAGGNGNTSAEGLKRIDSDVLPHMPGLVLVEFGGNDAVHDARAVSVEEFERNLLTIVEKVRKKGGDVVLVTFPPIINEWHAFQADPYYKKWGGPDQCVEQYRRRTREVGKRLDCPLFDLDAFLRKRIAGKNRDTYINRDGVHLTAEANMLIAPAILKCLIDNGKL